MKKMVVFSFPVLLVCFFLFSCQSLKKNQAHSVCDVMGNARKYSRENEISVGGKVTLSGGFGEYKGFTIRDTLGNCTLLVKTERITPEEGAVVVVKGQLKEIASFDKIVLLYLVEN